MIYACETKNCYFLFEGKKPPDRCPECGGTAIRAATEQEQAEYKQRQTRKVRAAGE